MLTGAAVSLTRQRQHIVALSTAEAEYMALTSATQEAMFLRQFMLELQQDSGSVVTIHEDNQSYIALRKSIMTTGRSKHMDVRCHFCREKGGEWRHRGQVLCNKGHACRCAHQTLGE
jgi:hypothetical protein